MPFIIAAVLVVVALAGVLFYSQRPEADSIVEMTTVSSEQPENEEIGATVTGEVDPTTGESTGVAPGDAASDTRLQGGTSFTSNQTITYLTPRRTSHEIAVAFTVEDGVVAGVSIAYDKKDGYSNDYQSRFDGAYKTEVIGKSLNEISLSRVGGASLTSEAFNQAAAAALSATAS